MLGLFVKIKDQYTLWLRNMSIKQAMIYSIIFIVFIALVLPWMSELSFELIKVEESIDTSLFTEIKELYHLREKYGSTGRYYYIIIRVTFDVIWPVVYFLFIASWTAYLSKSIKEPSTFRYINYLPLIAVSLDYLENLIAIIFMASYPYQIDIIPFLAIVVSLNKWLWIAFGFIQIIWLLLKRGVTYVRK